MKLHTRKTKILTLLLLTGITLYSCTKEEHFHTNDNPEAGGVTVSNIPDEIMTYEDFQLQYFKGDKLRLRINRTDLIVEEYEIEYDGAYDYDGERLIFCKTPKSLIVGAGDSGSPVLTPDGKIVAILCYGFEFANNQFAARAIEDVMLVGSSEKTINKGYSNLNSFLPLKPVYQVYGMNQQDFHRYTRNDKNGYFSNYSQFNSFYSGSIQKTASADVIPIPGHSICVMEVTGDFLSMTATGTASYISGNSIFGFGHEYIRSEPVAVPAFMASMVTMIESDWEAYKVAIPTEQSIGAMTKDDFEGILIRTDIEPSQYDYFSKITLRDGSVRINNHKVARFNVIDRETYHAVSIGPYLLYRLGYEGTGVRVRARGTIVIEYESDTFEYDFDVIDDSYWIDLYVYDAIRSELENYSYTGHINSVSFIANLSDV